MKEIEHWYDEKYDEWERLERHKIEFDITRRYMDEYIIGQNLDIFDIGGGPGRYSIYMLEESEYRKWLEICYQLSRDENLMGTSEHFLYIGRKNG